VLEHLETDDEAGEVVEHDGDVCQVKGQKFGRAKGNRGAQSPDETGTTVISTCHV
jgi:hypothetical protein